MDGPGGRRALRFVSFRGGQERSACSVGDGDGGCRLIAVVGIGIRTLYITTVGKHSVFTRGDTLAIDNV